MKRIKDVVLFLLACCGVPFVLLGMALVMPFIGEMEDMGRNRPDGSHT